jgi:DNA-binding GntR family transcriptional regulator
MDSSAENFSREIPLKIPGYRGLRQLVAESLREAILSGALKPGERLVENRLSVLMKVSRSPLREAIRELERDGLVVSIPNRGSIVATFTAEDVNEIYSIRERLESLAARWAAEKIGEEELARLGALLREMEAVISAGDPLRFRDVVAMDFDFHTAVVEAARAERLSRLLASLRDQVRMVMNTGMVTLTLDRCAAILQEHRALLDALSRRDRDRAERLMRHHIKAARLRIGATQASTEQQLVTSDGQTVTSGPTDRSRGLSP